MNACYEIQQWIPDAYHPGLGHWLTWATKTATRSDAEFLLILSEEVDWVGELRISPVHCASIDPRQDSAGEPWRPRPSSSSLGW